MGTLDAMIDGERLSALAGDAAAHDTAADGTPRVAPTTAAGMARVLREASDRVWHVRVEHDTWSCTDAPADLAISTTGLTTLADVSLVDQVATAGAGLPIDRLHGETPWCAADPPGTGRTIGGALSTGTSGPLRAGYGALRDQVLGLTVVTGDGRVLTVGGRVLKNVAGYDLSKLFIGGFDGFGIVVSVHLRLRATPRTDHTTLYAGSRTALLHLGLAQLEAGAHPAALELVGHASTWTLAMRRHDEGPAAPEGTPTSEDFWREPVPQPNGTVTFRVGTLPDSLPSALDLLDDVLPPPAWITASLYPGSVRWSGHATADQLTRARRVAAQHEMPLTLERAPWAIRASVGVHGAYREGIDQLVTTLRHAFDPAGVFVV